MISIALKNYPYITIITPTFNAETHLEQTINSVEAQNYGRMEYLIIDGGSTDGTLEIIRSSGSVTRWISEPDDGISDAFNKGIRMATGEIIGIINADDYYHPDAFCAVAEAVGESPEAGIYYGDAIHERFDGSGVFRFRAEQDVGRSIWRRMPVSHPATFVRKSVYEKYGLFDPGYRLAMDYDLILRMFLNGVKFQYCNSVLAHFRYGQDRGFEGLREVRDIATANGRSRYNAYIHYLVACIKASVRKFQTRLL